MELLIYLFLFLIMLGSGFAIGTAIENAHYEAISENEAALIKLPVVTSKNLESPDSIFWGQLVSGSVVISLDYFKRFLAGLRCVVGGRISSYETLLDRGRREAIVRMKKEAKRLNADMIINMRFETSSIGGQSISNKNQQIGCFELLAYGTAIRLKKSDAL